MMRSLLVILLIGSSYGLRAMGVAPRTAVAARAAVVMYGNLAADVLVERGKVSSNPLRNLMQMQDQRVAGVSQILLAPGKCTLPLEEAKALMASWRDEIGSDAAKFAEKARAESHCPSGPRSEDGKPNLGFITRGKCCEQFDDVIYSDTPGQTYGPLVSKAGLSLLYVHSCREPKDAGKD